MKEKTCKCCGKSFGRKPKNKRTYVAFVLDKSGSMSSIAKEAVSGFNEQVDVIKENLEKTGETFVTLVSFNHKIDEHFFNIDAEELSHISNSEYFPNGSTAMYDAVGYTLNKLKGFDRRGTNTAFLVVVISDGMENASTKYSANDIKELVQELEGTSRWTFAYIGSNQNLKEVSDKTGLKGVNFVSNKMGTNAMNSAVRIAYSSYAGNRGAGGQSMAQYAATIEEHIKKDETGSKQ